MRRGTDEHGLLKLKSRGIMFFLAFFISSLAAMAQNMPVSQDSVPGQSSSQQDRQRGNGNGGNQDGTGNSGAKGKGNIRQLSSAKPDMTRSRGARPPEIVRPSGSGIPRGVGRPAGAGRRGRN